MELKAVKFTETNSQGVKFNFTLVQNYMKKLKMI